jgi:hypothetical protein
LAGGDAAFQTGLGGADIISSFSFVNSGVPANIYLIKPDIAARFQGLIPTIPKDNADCNSINRHNEIVPYNLFLHVLVYAKWSGITGLREAQTDGAMSVVWSGLISILIWRLRQQACSAAAKLQARWM